MSYPSLGPSGTSSACRSGEGQLDIDLWPDGILVLDGDRRHILEANQGFLRSCGVERADELPSPLELVALEDRTAFLALGSVEDQPTREVAIRLTPVAKFAERVPDEEQRPMWVRAQLCVIDRNETRWVYFFRTEWAPPKQDESLHRRITGEAVQNSIQIYYVADRIRSAPKLAAHLFGVEDRDTLYERTASFLCSQAFNCREVTVILLEEGNWKPVFSTLGDEALAADASRQDRYQQFLEHRCQPQSNSHRLLPLPGPNGLFGLLELSFHPRELQLLERTEEVASWHNDLLDTIAEILALFMFNLELYHELKTLTIRDATTGLYNRRFLFTQLETEMARSRRFDRELSVLFIDLDNFKEINDCYGHRQGDLVLQELGTILSDSLRESDFVCRYGGDEFVIVLPEARLEAAREKAALLCERVQQHEFVTESSPVLQDEGQEVPPSLTLSIGIASSAQAETTRELLTRADDALYRAKGLGRNAVVVYSPEPA